jgi:glyoxylase-like metal-dependent hydrolase (beta-lactamase superfamily II)
MTKPLIAGFKDITCPAYSFLITHPPSGRRLLFDLGVRKDWENGPTGLVERTKKHGYGIAVEKNVADILPEHGVDTKEIEAVIWSHYHFDHTGDPSTFPKSTALVVGPGVVERFPTAWPSNAEAPVDEKAWAGRERKEISFEEARLKIGRFKAVDYFDDGSFYLLNTPGHLLGHMCGLARTTSDSFILMGGDAAHHAGEFRPTEYVPLPREVKIDSAPPQFPVPCPGHLIVDHIHPEQSATKPFYKNADGFNEDPEVADWSVDGITEFDADDSVFSIIAHDATLLPVVDFFPKLANDWKTLGWQTKGRWRFLADFVSGLEELKKAGTL